MKKGCKINKDLSHRFFTRHSKNSQLHITYFCTSFGECFCYFRFTTHREHAVASSWKLRVTTACASSVLWSPDGNRKIYDRPRALTTISSAKPDYNMWNDKFFKKNWILVQIFTSRNIINEPLSFTFNLHAGDAVPLKTNAQIVNQKAKWMQPLITIKPGKYC